MSDLRSRLGSLLDNLEDEDIKEIVEESLSATRLKWSYCPNCRKKVEADFPDLDKRAKFLATLLDQAKGKPAETKQVTVNVAHRMVSELSDEELEQLASGAEVIEGSFREVSGELPPAA
jgi:hypothetical protein